MVVRIGSTFADPCLFGNSGQSIVSFDDPCFPFFDTLKGTDLIESLVGDKAPLAARDNSEFNFAILKPETAGSTGV